MSSVIAWIIPSWTEYGPAKNLLNRDALPTAWEDHAPASPEDPIEYYYCTGTVKDHDVYLVNAEKERYVHRAAEIMAEELKAQGKNISVYIIGGLDYLANYTPGHLNIGDCVISTPIFDEEIEAYYQNIMESIPEESRKNAKNLLDAVSSLLYNQQGYTIGNRTCYAHALYDQSQADIESRMCVIPGLPFITVVGLCKVDLDQLELASTASAQTIMKIIEQMEKLE